MFCGWREQSPIIVWLVGCEADVSLYLLTDEFLSAARQQNVNLISVVVGNYPEHSEDPALIALIKSDVCVCVNCLLVHTNVWGEQIEVSHSVWRPNSNYCNTSSERQNTNCAGSVGLSPWACHWRSRLIMFDGESLEAKCAKRDVAPWISIRLFIGIVCSYSRFTCWCSWFSNLLFLFLRLHLHLFCPPAEANCTYFKFFTTGENAVLFQKTTQKSESHTSFIRPLSTVVPPYPPTPPPPSPCTLFAPSSISFIFIPLPLRHLPHDLSPSFAVPLSPSLPSPPRHTLSGRPLSASVWNLFRLRCIQASPSCRLTSHFTGSSITY